MMFLILIYLVLVSLPLPWPGPLVGGGLAGSIAATTTVAILPVVVAAVIAERTRRCLLAAPYRRDEILPLYARARSRNVLALMLFHGLSMTVFGWGWAVRELCGAANYSQLPFGAELIVMAPFVFSLVLSWAAFYPVERTAAEISIGGDMAALPFAGRWQYVLFVARQHFAIICVPLGLFLLEQGLVRQFPDAFAGVWAHVGMIGLALLALTLAPWVLRIVLSTEPLPPGPLRARLEAAARRVRLRYSDILVWNTHSGVANAMVAGPLPWVRYVFLSDRLLETLPPDEVEAVFGHETGHVRHGHFHYYMLFIVMSLIALGGLWATGLSFAIGEPLHGDADISDWLAVPEVALVGAYMFVAFGFLSRRCERQADLFGCRTVSCGDASCVQHTAQTALVADGRALCPSGIRTFIRALERVAAINGICRRKPGWLQSWLHSTIARRVEFLEAVVADPMLARRFQRRVTLVKWGIIGLLAGVFVLLGFLGFWSEAWSALSAAG